MKSSKLRSTDMWAVCYFSGTAFYPVDSTVTRTRRDSIKAFVNNAITKRKWAYYRYPKGFYEVFKVQVRSR